MNVLARVGNTVNIRKDAVVTTQEQLVTVAHKLPERQGIFISHGKHSWQACVELTKTKRVLVVSLYDLEVLDFTGDEK